MMMMNPDRDNLKKKERVNKKWGSNRLGEREELKCKKQRARCHKCVDLSLVALLIGEW